MQVDIDLIGAECGTFTNSETGEVIRWAAFYQSQSMDEKNGVGVKPDRLKATGEAYDAIKAKKLPCTVKCELQMQPTATGHRVKVLKVLQ